MHIAIGENELNSSRHPCFKLESGEALVKLQKKIWEHHEKGGESAPKAADKPGEVNSGTLKTSGLLRDAALHIPSHRKTGGLLTSHTGPKGVEYTQRFFARDYAGNRLEFSL